jgi:ADP-ribosyl-[dinitrogen reductase] hydrolase
MTLSLESRYAGALIGAACGDALGGTVEFMSRSAIALRYPNGLRDIIGGGWLHLAPGETTDDTAMMLAVARACTSDGIDLDLVARNFVAWKQTGPKDIGNQTSQALALLERGLGWDEAGEQLQRESARGIAGNGSVMRCAPVALRFRSDHDRLVRAAMDTSRITHADPRATWGTVAICQAIAHLLNGGSLETVLAAASAGVQDDDVVSAIDAAASLPYEDVRSGGFVIDTITAAFWALVHESSLEDVIVRAVMMGSDTDTTATVAGAMAGAAYGLEAIPTRWRDIVHHREELEGLARQLLAWDLDAEGVRQ